jgi:hypothetical protein
VESTSRCPVRVVDRIDVLGLELLDLDQVGDGRPR